MYGKYYDDMVLEMNASDDRGIRIQETIENFRKAYVYISNEDKQITPLFKIVILDEADNMTDKAKHIISVFIKNCVKTLRFAFTCNTKDNISFSLQSGCHIVKYPPLSNEICYKRICDICKLEGIINADTDKDKMKIIDEGIKAIIQITNGDLRSAINMLQITYNRYNTITSDNVFTIHDNPHPEKSKEIIVLCRENRLGDAITKVIDMKRKGYSGTDIIIGLRLALRLDICNDIPENIRIEFWKHISYSSYNISKGLDTSLLQITACIADMCCAIKKLQKS